MNSRNGKKYTENRQQDSSVLSPERLVPRQVVCGGMTPDREHAEYSIPASHSQHTPTRGFKNQLVVADILVVVVFAVLVLWWGQWCWYCCSVWRGGGV